MTTDLRYSLDELARLAGIRERQIRELVRLDILPPPSSGGRGATYGQEHLDRLRAWKVLREKLPPRTTNRQLRVLLDRLHDQRLLRSIAEGKTPFELIDDRKEDVTIEGFTGTPLTARLSREAPAVRDMGVSQGEGTNQAALAYLSSMPRGAAARITLPSVTRAPRLEVDLGPSDSSGAGLSLSRLQSALEDYVAAHAAEVRVKPPRTETWQRVTVGRDLEISARGPLMPDEIQLLETIGQLLQQAIYRKER